MGNSLTVYVTTLALSGWSKIEQQLTSFGLGRATRIARGAGCQAPFSPASKGLYDVVLGVVTV